MSSFVKKFKAQKAIDLFKSANLKKALNSGDFLWMFGSRYQVHNNSEQQIILIDENGIRIAVPAEGLLKLLDQGFIKKDGYFKKAEDSGEASALGSAKEGGTSGRAKEGFPLNTIRNGRIKVSMNPPRWIDYQTGHSHGDHQTEEKHSTKTKEVSAMVDKAMDSVKGQIHPDDTEKLKEQFHSVLEEQVKLDNLKKVASTAIKGKGTSLENMRKAVYSQKDKIQFHTKKLKEAFKESAKRKQNGR